MNLKKLKVSKARLLHRSLGAGAAIFVLFMVLSGLAINHSNGFGFDQRHVSQSFVLDWYGLAKPENINSFAVGDDWLSFAGSQLFLNDNPVATLPGGVGAVSSGDLLVAAGSEELLLLDHDGNLIERLSWEFIGGAPIESIGLYDSKFVSVKSAGQLWLADNELLNWRQAANISPDPVWAVSTQAPDSLQQALTASYRGEGPSLERLLLDLHSGRIFGTIGVLVYDLLALALGFLSISGLILWFRSRRNGKRK